MLNTSTWAVRRRTVIYLNPAVDGITNVISVLVFNYQYTTFWLSVQNGRTLSILCLEPWRPMPLAAGLFSPQLV